MTQPSRLVLIEASKVRYQHSTFVDGLIRAYCTEGLDRKRGRLRLLAHRSLFETLTPEARQAVDFVPIRVMDPTRRRLIRKTLLEAWVVLRALARARDDEILMVTTILPSALILVELGKRLFRRKPLVIVQHGELEGALDPKLQRRGSYGYYVLRWLEMRRRTASTISVVAPDQFIKETLLRLFPGSIRPDRVFAIPIPMIPAALPPPGEFGATRICFIGFDTPNKGFEVYAELARALPDLDFRVIGNGLDRSLTHGDQRPVGSNEEFLAAVARCDVAVFPYSGGYSLGLSAAATDAIATGLHLIATDRPCFLALAEAFGPEVVTICVDASALKRQLSDRPWVRRRRTQRAARPAQIAASRYGLAQVGSAMEAMMASIEAGHG